MVFGDFDADGLTGLAQLVLAFRRLGLDVVPYVPSRLEEGHGLSMAAVERPRATGVDADRDRGHGLDERRRGGRGRGRAGSTWSITDHHHLPEVLPAAVAIVNPHRADSVYPDPELSGSGVAFTVARLLLGELLDAEAEALELADLATIGTVVGRRADPGREPGDRPARPRADARPRRGPGSPRSSSGPASRRRRSTSRPSASCSRRGSTPPGGWGRRWMPRACCSPRRRRRPRRSPRPRGGQHHPPGPDARRDRRGARGVRPAGPGPGARPAGAAGRPAAESRDPCRRRPDAPAMLVRGPWPVGIVGLVAGRLADETGPPGDRRARRDRRRDPGVVPQRRAAGPRRDADACDDLFIRHGGHAAAAGLRAAGRSLGRVRRRGSSRSARGRRARGPAPPARGGPRAARGATWTTACTGTSPRLAPCGTGNPEPLVAVLGLTVQRVRAANGGHTQLVLRRERDVLDGIAFGRPDLAETLAEGDRVDVVARLASRAFGGLETLQLEVRDVAASARIRAPPRSWRAPPVAPAPRRSRSASGRRRRGAA